MPNGKPRRPSLTPNQEAWRREERRIKQILYRMEKDGFKFSREELLPQRPTKITKRSIERLKATTPAILRGYAEVPEGFKGRIETQKSKRKATYLSARSSGRGAPVSHVPPAPDPTKTEAATEEHRRKARERYKEKSEKEKYQKEHVVNAMSVVVANVEAELTSGPYDDVSQICLEKFRSMLANKRDLLYYNIMFSAESLIEAAHIVSYASQQEVRVRYGHLFLTLIYGGNIPKSVRKQLLDTMPYGTEDYDVAWETDGGIEQERQAKGGRPRKEITEQRRANEASLDAMGKEAMTSKEKHEKLNEIRKEVGLPTVRPPEAESELDIIKNSLEAFDSSEWDIQMVDENVTSKDGMIEYKKKKLMLVNRNTGEMIDYGERLKQFSPKNKRGGENVKASGAYMKRGKGRK